MIPKSVLAATLLAATALGSVAVDAKTIRWARIGDSLTLDPHAQNEGPTHTLAHHIYETLVWRDDKGRLLPRLAASWKIAADPTVWEFKLRPNVKFHDGSAFTAEDVVFSLQRAMMPTSDMKGLFTAVDSVTVVDDLTVNVKTKGPSPLFVNNLTNTFIMDKGWSEKNNVTKPQDYKNKEENYAVRNANGTGPFTLVSREAEVKTVLKANANHWGKSQYGSQVTEIVYTPIKADATRIAALLSGEVDFVQDVPVQDVERLQKTKGVRVETGPENRTIYFGVDLSSPELKSSDVKGKNPFADVRVRQAMFNILDREAIKKVVMRGQSVPAGMAIPSFVNGYSKQMDAFPKPDVAAAKKLLAEAGYPNGFSVNLDCPNDRYLNDEAICQAYVGMLGRIGIKATLVSQSRTLHFPKVQKAETDFFLMGWGVPPFDSDYVFNFLIHTKNDRFGGWNASKYSNAAVDQMTQSLATDTNIPNRNATIGKIWAQLQKDVVLIPVHHQMLAYAMKTGIDINVHPENQPNMVYARYPQPKPAQ